MRSNPNITQNKMSKRTYHTARLRVRSPPDDAYKKKSQYDSAVAKWYSVLWMYADKMKSKSCFMSRYVLQDCLRSVTNLCIKSVQSFLVNASNTSIGTLVQRLQNEEYRLTSLVVCRFDLCRSILSTATTSRQAHWMALQKYLTFGRSREWTPQSTSGCTARGSTSSIGVRYAIQSVSVQRLWRHVCSAVNQLQGRGGRFQRGVWISDFGFQISARREES